MAMNWMLLGQAMRHHDYSDCLLMPTGPGPATFLDGQNVVFGRVLSGIDTVSTIANVPTYAVDKRIQWMNQFAETIGDERAAKARARWTKPQKPVVITACGLL